jgi:predicted O-linked N-acetylglucosamine transferase (SPINDLY family)
VHTPLRNDPFDARLSQALNARDWPLLVRLCRQALRKNGRHLRAHRLLGFALNEQRETDAAIDAYRKASIFWPDDAELLINYASVLQKHGRDAEAGPLLEKVCALRPEQAISWIKLAQSCYTTQQHKKGLAAGEKAAELATSLGDQVAALTQKSIHRRELGQIREAVRECEAAIRLYPQDPANHTNRLLFMLADPSVNERELAAAAREFADVFEAPLRATWPTFAERRHGPWRRLKVGFLSPDFRTHSVMYFVEGLLAQLDRRQFEVWAFYLYPQDDSLTRRVQCHVDHFVRLAGMSGEEQAQVIRENEIDILIDLAGHTGHNGLLAMARKPAPIQATWVGYPGTTGLEAVDYLITDAATDPIGVDDLYSERLFRLPNRLCVYRPMSRHPLWRYQPLYTVRPTPALQNGFITFGSCNNLGKLTDEVLATWAQILDAVPGSRLLIEGKNLGAPEFAQAYRDRCAALGIPADRLELVPLDPANQYVTYHRIDIALDPFPLNGGTTSMDVLWMGVPLVAMEGSNFKSRLSTGILYHLGRTEWLATSKDGYVRIAAGLAADLHRLNAIRLGLRRETENSTLMREDIFNGVFADALRTMWQTWLAEGACPGAPEHQREILERWKSEKPVEWGTPPVPGVGLEPGHRVSLPDAHQRLMQLVDQCKSLTPNYRNGSDRIVDSHWRELTELAETVLTAVPHDPVALACLAEVEFAHGQTDFAVTYLRYAQEALANSAH